MKIFAIKNKTFKITSASQLVENCDTWINDKIKLSRSHKEGIRRADELVLVQ